MASVSIIGPDEHVYPLHKVACLATYLRRHTIATESLLEGSGIPISSLHDARSRVSRRQLFATFRNFIRLAPSDHSALDAGAAFHISNFGFYGYGLLSAPTFREAADFAVTYRQLATPMIDMRLAQSCEDAAWEFTELRDIPEDLSMKRFTYDLQSAIHLALHRSVLGADFRFASADFPYPAPSYADHYHAMFACPVQFNAPTGRLSFPVGWLERSPVGSDPITHSMVKDVCDGMLAQFGSNQGVAGEIYRRLISRPAAFPDLERMASELHISARTLRRHLRTVGCTYQQVVDEVRLHLAIKYLIETDVTHEDIAARLDFSTATSFRRAFRRWTGKSAGQFRAAVRRTMS
jgi:AraC-like DNA-binding protein